MVPSFFFFASVQLFFIGLLGEYTTVSQDVSRTTTAGRREDTLATTAWQVQALSVDVSRVFADGQQLRDAYSGQLATVEGGQVRMTPAPQSGGLLLLEAAAAQAKPDHDWRNATVYFALTDRFANGDPSNDRSYGRQPDGEQEIGTFHGGDLKGLTGQLDYLQQLGQENVEAREAELLAHFTEELRRVDGP